MGCNTGGKYLITRLFKQLYICVPSSYTIIVVIENQKIQHRKKLSKKSKTGNEIKKLGKDNRTYLVKNYSVLLCNVDPRRKWSKQIQNISSQPFNVIHPDAKMNIRNVIFQNTTIILY